MNIRHRPYESIYTITLYDHNRRLLKETTLERVYDPQIVREEAQVMLADYLEKNPTGMVEITGPGGLIIIYQNPGDLEPTEVRHERSVEFSDFE